MIILNDKLKLKFGSIRLQECTKNRKKQLIYNKIVQNRCNQTIIYQKMKTMRTKLLLLHQLIQTKTKVQIRVVIALQMNSAHSPQKTIDSKI